MTTRTIAARFVDASRGHAGSGWVPALPYLSVPLALVLARSTPACIVSAAVVGFAALAVPRLWRLAFRGDTTIHVRPGRVRIGWSIVLRARDIEGASTARTGGGIVVTLKPKRLEPISLVFADETSAHEVLAALGIGHTGVGRLDWLLVPRVYRHTVALFDFALAAMLGVSLAYLAIGSMRYASQTLFLGLIAMTLSALARAQWRSMGARVLFDPWGVWLGRQQIPWTSIRDANDQPDGIQLGFERGNALVRIPPGSIGQAEKEVLLDQILAGIGRAHGRGAPKTEPHTRIDILGRSGEEVRRWLTRVDAVAANIGKAGYRAASIELADLWLTLEDPEASVDLRVASARVLARIAPDDRVRIDAVISATRDLADAKRMRIAMEPDADEAAELLERLGA
jgi:hypothetical protein